MIVRSWRGVVKPGRIADYREHLERRVFPQLAGLPGHRGALLLARELSEGREVVAVTLWDGLEAIAAFTGSDLERAVVEPEAAALMLAVEPAAVHHELLLSANLAAVPPKAGRA